MTAPSVRFDRVSDGRFVAVDEPIRADSDSRPVDSVEHDDRAGGRAAHDVAGAIESRPDIVAVAIAAHGRIFAATVDGQVYAVS